MKRNIKIFQVILLTGFAAWLLLTSFRAAQTVDTNARIKAMFIYNFTRYVEWPSGYKQGNFIIGVMGNQSLRSELEKMAATKQAGSQSIEVRNFSSAGNISKCHMLILAQDAGASLNEVLSRLKGQSTLLITEKAGMAKQGSAINFVVQNNKQAFEVNRSNAEKYDLKVSSNLLTLAIVVE